MKSSESLQDAYNKAETKLETQSVEPSNLVEPSLSQIREEIYQKIHYQETLCEQAIKQSLELKLELEKLHTQKTSCEQAIKKNLESNLELKKLYSDLKYQKESKNYYLNHRLSDIKRKIELLQTTSSAIYFQLNHTNKTLEQTIKNFTSFQVKPSSNFSTDQAPIPINPEITALLSQLSIESAPENIAEYKPPLSPPSIKHKRIIELQKDR